LLAVAYTVAIYSISTNQSIVNSHYNNQECFKKVQLTYETCVLYNSCLFIFCFLTFPLAYFPICCYFIRHDVLELMDRFHQIEFKITHIFQLDGIWEIKPLLNVTPCFFTFTSYCFLCHLSLSFVSYLTSYLVSILLSLQGCRNNKTIRCERWKTNWCST
jgi:hypothetical protein